MADVYSCIYLDTDDVDGTRSYGGELNATNRDAKFGSYPSGRYFTSVSAWETDRDGNSSSGDDEYGRIVGQWASADTTQCLIDGWNADKIIIECPLTLPDGDNEAAHNGIYGNKTNAYKNEYSGGTNLYLRFEDADLIGVQAKCDTAYSPAIRLRGSSNTMGVYRCVVHCTDTNVDGITDISNITSTGYIENTVVTSIRFGIDISTGMTAGHIINCTVDGIDNNEGIKAQTTIKVRNCAVFNNNDDFDTVTDIQYCASDDGDGTNEVDWTAEATDWASNFNAYATYDYTPLDDDLPGAGVGPGTDADVPTIDILGNTRSGTTCTIGAFEYQDESSSSSSQSISVSSSSSSESVSVSSSSSSESVSISSSSSSESASDSSSSSSESISVSSSSSSESLSNEGWTWGEQNPDPETPVEWSVWKVKESANDARDSGDWGKLQLIANEEFVSDVKDIGSAGVRYLKLSNDDYAVGSGSGTLYWRGQAAIFNYDDNEVAGPTWAVYSPGNKDWRYVQIMGKG